MIRHRLTATALLMAVLLATASPTPARNVYRWVDDAGVTQYTQYPPPDRPAERIEATASPAYEPQQSRAESGELLESAGERVARERLEREEAERLRQSRAERAAWCPQARQELQALRSRPRIRDEEDGYRLLSEEERAERARVLQEKIERRCRDL